MPELPEVETVRRGLTQLVEGSTIKSVDVLYPKMINLSPNDFKKKSFGERKLNELIAEVSTC